MILDIISGPDKLDSTTINERLKPINVQSKINIKNMKIGIPREYLHSSITAEILETWLYVTNIFKNAGAIIEEVWKSSEHHL